MEFRPCIDLHNGQVKQIVGSTLDQNEKPVENFVSQRPAGYYADLFKQDGVYGGHVIMLGKGNEKAAIEALQAFPQGLQIGGGIHADNALYYLTKGASHVIVTSYIFYNGALDLDHLNKLVGITGKDQLVLDLSCRKKEGRYYVVTDRWQQFTDFYLSKENIGFLEEYCSELLVHGVDVEGKKLGIDKELTALLADCTSTPVTYAGGVSGFDDLEVINETGRGKINVTIGSALDIFGGHMSYQQTVKWFSGRKHSID